MPLLEEQLYLSMQRHCTTSHCLLIEDTSQVGFSLERAIKGIGKMDKGQIQGFYIHPVVAIDAVHYGCYGIAGLEFVSRTWHTLSAKEVACRRSKTAFEEKEGYRWFSSIQKSLSYCTHVATKTVIADREADVYPLWVGLREELAVDYVIRCRFDRPTKSGTSLLQEVENWSQEGCYSVNVPATDQRSAHTAELVIKYGQVALKRSQGKSIKSLPDYHSCYVVEVKELQESVVGNEPPIHWLLVTSHGVSTIEMALQIVQWYKQRWNIEQVFRTLKTRGLRIESSQLDSYEKLQKITLLALIAAVKVLQLIKARDGTTSQPIAAAFSEAEQTCMLAVNKQLEGKTEKLKNPYSSDTLAFAAWVIARLAGWSGYKSQRPAGPIDFLIGLQRFNERFEGFMLAMDT